MVKRWKAEASPVHWEQTDDGDVVAYSDYLALQKALEEALALARQPIAFNPIRCPQCPPASQGSYMIAASRMKCLNCGHAWIQDDPKAERISQLRSKYLDQTSKTESGSSDPTS